MDEALPAELLLNVFSYLGVCDLCSALQVCTKFYACGSPNELWRAHVSNMFLDGLAYFKDDAQYKSVFRKLYEINFNGNWAFFNMREYDHEEQLINVMPLYISDDVEISNKSGKNIDGKDNRGSCKIGGELIPGRPLMGVGKAAWGDFVTMACQWGQYVCCVNAFINSNFRTVLLYESSASGLAMLGCWFTNWYNLLGMSILSRVSIPTSQDVIFQALMNANAMQNSTPQWEGLLGDWRIKFTYKDGHEEIFYFSISSQRKAGVLGVIKEIYAFPPGYHADLEEAKIMDETHEIIRPRMRFNHNSPNATNVKPNFHFFHSSHGLDFNQLFPKTDLATANLGQAKWPAQVPRGDDVDRESTKVDPLEEQIQQIPIYSAGLGKVGENSTEHAAFEDQSAIPWPHGQFQPHPDQAQAQAQAQAQPQAKPPPQDQPPPQSHQQSHHPTVFLYDDGDWDGGDGEDEDEYDEDEEEEGNDHIPGVLGSILGRCIGLSFYVPGDTGDAANSTTTTSSSTTQARPNQSRFVTCIGQFEQRTVRGTQRAAQGPAHEAQVLRITPHEYRLSRGAMRGHFVEKRLDADAAQTQRPRMEMGTWRAVRSAVAHRPFGT